MVIGAVLIPGAKCPMLVRKEHFAHMKPGSVIVDVAVHQGGCCQTTRPTTHSYPVCEIDGVVHYGVANIPGAGGRTSTFALSNATLPYVIRLANLGYRKAAAMDPGLACGINAQEGNITHEGVAEAFSIPFEPAAVA